MRKFLFTAGAVLLLAAPAMAQSVTTQSKSVTVESSPAPLVVPPSKVEIVPAPSPALPGIAQERSSSTSTITNSGDGGMSRTERNSEKYIGTDGMVHEDRTIQHEESR